MQTNFLDDSSEMATRIREFAWEQTSLGLPERWPATLRAVVRLALTTQHPIFIFWGEEHICLYNDAYSASLGPEKHPRILGALGQAAWPEIWDVIGPQIDLVMRGDGATWHQNQLVPIIRHGEVQDVYWTYSFGPIEEDSAPFGVGGVLVICTETTKQVTASRRLADDRERFARLFEQAPGFMVMLSGPEHRIELANPAYFRLIGDRDVLGRTVAEALPEAADQGFLALLDTVYRSGKAYAANGVTYSFRSRNGTVVRHLDFVYQPITDERGGVTGIFVEGIDVSERRDADAALRASQAELHDREEQLRLATEAADVGLWDVDLVAGTLYWPPRVKAMFGISPESSVSMTDFYSGLHLDDVARTITAFEAALDSGRRTTYDVEYRTVGKEDGRIRWVAAKGRGIFDADGKCIRAIGTAIDITNRKADEVRLRELNDQLEQRVEDALADKKILADVVEGTDAFVLVAALNFRLLAINKAGADEFERVYGIRPRVGDGLLELLQDQPQHQAEVKDMWGRALSGEEFTAVGEFGDEARDRRHYEIKFNVLRNYEGERIGAFQFVHDVTDRVRDQAKLTKAEDALRQAQKMEAVGQLTGGIAHDFNNLLQTIQSALRLIDHAPSDPRVQGWAQTGMKSIKRGAELTSQLLTFAREQQIEPRAIVVAHLIEEMRDMVQRSLGPLIRFETRVDVVDAMVLADPTQLEMAILNLAINGRDAMSRGGSLTICTAFRWFGGHPSLPSGEYVEIAVSDEGTGMTPQIAARAFDPFFTTKDIGKGTGLGLSQVYGMARQAGGTASIQSNVGQGTTVTIVLPRLQLSVTSDFSPTSDAQTGAQQLSKSRILVVDDDDEVRKMLVESLEILGHEVIAANDGPTGLQALGTKQPDLLIVDFAMPGKNGAQVAQQARSRRPELPIVFASGYADTVAIDAVEGPAAAILRKPFDLDVLDKTIRTLLEKGTRTRG